MRYTPRKSVKTLKQLVYFYLKINQTAGNVIITKNTFSAVTCKKDLRKNKKMRQTSFLCVVCRIFCGSYSVIRLSNAANVSDQMGNALIDVARLVGIFYLQQMFTKGPL